MNETWPKLVEGQLIPVDSISEVKTDNMFFKKVIYPPYFEPLPRKHQLRYEFKNCLKTCTNKVYSLTLRGGGVDATPQQVFPIFLRNGKSLFAN